MFVALEFRTKIIQSEVLYDQSTSIQIYCTTVNKYTVLDILWHVLVIY